MSRPFWYLVIVESPGKVKKIQHILGNDYLVRASCGHICDLPQDKSAIDLENGTFEERYEVMPDKARIVKDLKNLARQAKGVFLATDPDREGEAIAWHIARHLPQTAHVKRVTFNAITPDAIRQAFLAPRNLHTNLINAYRTRRIIDRLIGFEITPLLWGAHIQSQTTLSAGRVQSATLNLLVALENERRAFKSRTYWTLEARLGHERGDFTAKLQTPATIDRPEDLRHILSDLDDAKYWWVSDLQTYHDTQKPLPPFTTSTLQQEASKRFKLKPKQTDAAAQSLYEAGYITYMRTDSVHVAPEAQAAARIHITRLFEEAYLPPTAPTYMNSAATTQEAHEAIRPTRVELQTLPLDTDLDQVAQQLYELIWQRFMASQMAPAVYQISEAYIQAGRSTSAPLPYSFMARARMPVFPGFQVVYMEAAEEDAEQDDSLTTLPPVQASDSVHLHQLETKEHQTKPPQRFTQARLIAQMERRGIGRPSTYAATLDVLLRRGYAEMSGHHIVPTALGEQVLAFLLKHFNQLFEVTFTAQMEGSLDRIVAGEVSRGQVLNTFYGQLGPAVSAARAMLPTQPTASSETASGSSNCPQCAKPLRLRSSAYGNFYGCSGYPNCKFTRPVGGTRKARRYSKKRTGFKPDTNHKTRVAAK